MVSFGTIFFNKLLNYLNNFVKSQKAGHLKFNNYQSKS